MGGRRFLCPLYFPEDGRPGVSAPYFFRLFLPFPQGSPVVHSFFTTRLHFPVAMNSWFPQSASSANVRCTEPAGDCSRAGGDRRFSRVNRREGFRNELRHVPEDSGVAASSKGPSEKRDLTLPLRQSLQVKSANRVFADLAPAECDNNGHSSGNAVGWTHSSPPRVAMTQARHSRAMRPRWLAWAAFILRAADRSRVPAGS